MEQPTINESSAGEPRCTTPTEIQATSGARHFEQEFLPDFVNSGPILPVWLSDRLSKLFGRAASPH